MTSPSSTHPFGFLQPPGNNSVGYVGMGPLGLQAGTPRNMAPSQSYQGRLASSGASAHLTGSTNSMGTIGQFSIPHSSRSFASSNLMNSTGMSNSFSSNPGLDLSEFPTLTNRNNQDSNSNQNLPPNLMAGRQPYVGMVKQPTNESNEFQIHNEDFPALPGSQSQEPSQDNINKQVRYMFSRNFDDFKMTCGMLDLNKENRFSSNDKISLQAQKRGIQTHKDGRVTSIPSTMVTDQFGMVGLLTFIRAAETEPNLVSLALGNDLTTLGLNLNTPESLYPTFGGPWSDQQCRPQDIDMFVPNEYIVNQNIKDKLSPIKLNRYGDDLLFFIFYMYSGDLLQLAAAHELYSREWRYHKDERVWITRAPGMNPTEKTSSYERGTYYFFDVMAWRKVPKDFHLDYDRLEDRPQVPQGSSQAALHSS